MLVGGVVAVVAVVVIVVVTAGGSGDAGSALPQYREVELVGDPLPPLGDEATDVAVGTQAPVVRGAAFDGTAVTIEPGRPTLLAFVAHWCPHCQAEVPRIVDWIESGDVPEQLRVVMVSTSATSTRPNFPPSAWLEREGYDGEVLVDDQSSSTAQAFGLQNFPMLVLLDADGKVLWRESGEQPEGQLAILVNEALGA